MTLDAVLFLFDCCSCQQQAQKFWFVIDGRLLNWFTDTDLKNEIDFLHLSKLKRITYVPDESGTARQFSLDLKDGSKMTLECSSSDPNLSTHDYTMSWMTAIQQALTAQPAEEKPKSEGRRASIVAATESELQEEEGGDGDEDGFNEDDFGDFGDEGGGFGGFEEDGFGEDEEEGGAAADEEEEDEEGVEQFGDDFGGFDDEDGEEGDEFGGFE